RSATPPLPRRNRLHSLFARSVGLDRPRLREPLPPTPLSLINAPQQRPNVVPRLPLVQELAEHLHPRHHALPRLVLHPHDLDLVPHLHDPPLYPPPHHPPPPPHSSNVLHPPQKPPLPPPLPPPSPPSPAP